jgi:hypothetical protein
MSIQVALIIVELLVIGGLVGAMIMSMIYNPYGTAEHYFKSKGSYTYSVKVGNNIVVFYDKSKKGLYMVIEGSPASPPTELHIDKRDKAGHSYKIEGDFPINCGSDGDSTFKQLCKAKTHLDGQIMIRFSKDYKNIDLFIELENSLST